MSVHDGCVESVNDRDEENVSRRQKKKGNCGGRRAAHLRLGQAPSSKGWCCPMLTPTTHELLPCLTGAIITASYESVTTINESSQMDSYGTFK